MHLMSSFADHYVANKALLPTSALTRILSRMNRLENHRAGHRLAVDDTNKTQDPRCSADVEDRP